MDTESEDIADGGLAWAERSEREVEVLVESDITQVRTIYCVQSFLSWGEFFLTYLYVYVYVMTEDSMTKKNRDWPFFFQTEKKYVKCIFFIFQIHSDGSGHAQCPQGVVKLRLSLKLYRILTLKMQKCKILKQITIPAACSSPGDIRARG